MSIRITSNNCDNCENIINHRFHPEKKGIRVFGVAESFRAHGIKSTIAGVVMRRDLIIDGIILSNATLKGNDSTENILCMFRSLKREDINCIILDGLIISMYNIIDGKLIQSETGLPVIAITFEDSAGLETNIRHHFPDNPESKLEQYAKLGKRDQVLLKTGKYLFIRYWGLSLKHAITILNSFTLQGSIPEPIRVAKLVARSTRTLYKQMKNDDDYV
ncbi:MAG: DUF99 family protein [Nitrososphaeraceae archaeon]